jgi:predicted Kef-type K+ transport protein
MFGVGLHFSFKDLMSVRAIAVPGAVVQIAAATLMARFSRSLSVDRDRRVGVRPVSSVSARSF